MTHRKTADRELGDLKLGQRVLVRYLDGIASRVLILYPRPVREGGESRKDELKAERQREADRPREGERPREDDAGHDGDLRTVNGELKHIEPGVLIILVRKDGGVELEHKVPTAVKMEVFVNNGPATAEQLKIGQRVRVRLNAAGSATRIDIRKKEGKQEGGEKPRSFGFLNQSEVSLPPAIN